MMHESEENPAPTPVGVSNVSKGSGGQPCCKERDVKLVPNIRAYRPSVPMA